VSEKKTYLFDRPRNVQRILWLLYVCAAILLALDFVIHRHTEHPWEWLPGFYPAWGFVGCVVLVVAAKWLRRVIIRPEDYYRRRDLPRQPGEEEEAS